MRKATDLRRRQIGEVVLDILIAEGPSGVSVQNVAERIGVVPSALYRHFSSLEEMLEAGLNELKERLAGMYDGARMESAAPLDILERTLTGSRRVMPLIVAMPKLLFGKVDISGNLMRFIGCLQDEMLERWARLFAAAQNDGFVRRDVEPATLALIYWGMLTHSFLRWVATEGEFDVANEIKDENVDASVSDVEEQPNPDGEK